MSYKLNRTSLVEDGLDKFFFYETIAYAENLDEVKPRRYMVASTINREEIAQAFTAAGVVERYISINYLITNTRMKLLLGSNDETSDHLLNQFIIGLLRVRMLHVIEVNGDTTQDVIVLEKSSPDAPVAACEVLPFKDPAGDLVEAEADKINKVPTPDLVAA